MSNSQDYLKLWGMDEVSETTRSPLTTTGKDPYPSPCHNLDILAGLSCKLIQSARYISFVDVLQHACAGLTSLTIIEICVQLIVVEAREAMSLGSKGIL